MFLTISTSNICGLKDNDAMTVKNASAQQYAQDRLDPLLLPSPNLPSDVKLIRQNNVTVGGNSGWKIEFMKYGANKGLMGPKYNEYFSEIYTVANGKPYRLAYSEDSLKFPKRYH
jgi:hypothetical protein